MKKEKSIDSANGLPFDSLYWYTMYTEDENSIIDGIYNAKEIAAYLNSVFKMLDIKIKKIGDFGFGLGILLKQIIEKLKPDSFLALDISEESVNRLIQKKWIQKYTMAIHNKRIQDFDFAYIIKNPLDLGIFNSVIQYIPDKDVAECFQKLSQSCKYLYMSVPTNLDYKYMAEHLNFVDPYAYSRSKEFYRNAWEQHFAVVSYNLLESKKLVTESPFGYEIFRF